MIDTQRVLGKERRSLRYRGFNVGPAQRVPLESQALRAPASAHTIVAKTFGLYRSYALLFLVLALCVTGPYDLLMLIVTGSGPLTNNSDFGLTFPLATFLVLPLISALHIHAVADIDAGRAPRLRSIATRGLRVLPTAAATAIMTTLGMLLGFMMLVVPGLVLALRWYVAVQAAAVEHDGWLSAIRRSRQLTAGIYGHLIRFWILIVIIGSAPLLVAKAAVTGHDTLAVVFIGGVLLHAFALAFAALARALLYFDVASRHDAGPPPAGDHDAAVHGGGSVQTG